MTCNEYDLAWEYGVEIEKDGEKIPITPIEAQALWDKVEWLREDAYVLDGYGVAGLVESHHYDGRLIILDACIRDKNTDYVRGMLQPGTVVEILEVWG